MTTTSLFSTIRFAIGSSFILGIVLLASKPICAQMSKKSGNNNIHVEIHRVNNNLADTVFVEQMNGDVDMRIMHRADTIYKRVPIMPEFEGGEAALIQFLGKEVKYPGYEKEQKIEGRVIAEFVVDEKGKITEPKILRSPEQSKNFEQEVLRVLRAMPNWKPGYYNDKAVKVYMTLPVSFALK